VLGIFRLITFVQQETGQLELALDLPRRRRPGCCEDFEDLALKVQSSWMLLISQSKVAQALKDHHRLHNSAILPRRIMTFGSMVGRPDAGSARLSERG
jgi:hypothetical protein